MRTVDIELDTDVWIGVPGEWTEETFPDHRDWARAVAETVWNGVAPRPGEEGPDHLALTLAMVAESPLMDDPARRAFLWLPGPVSEVLPVYLEAFVAEGDREESLRELTLADAPGAVEPPIVEPFVTGLGEGLRVLRYAADPEDGAVVLGLSYAWRAGDLDVRLWLSTFDTGLALRALDDVDALARAVRLVYD
jgi:hypothetical protein